MAFRLVHDRIFLRRSGRPAGRGVWVSGGLLALAFSAGCARYQPRPIAPQQTATALGARSLSDDGLHRFVIRAEMGRTGNSHGWPLASWDLDDLTLAADYFQPDLAVARAQWGVSQAATITAGERPNPSISASGTYDTTTPPPWIPAVSFDIPIETAGKRGDRLTQAHAQAEAARWDLVSKVWQVRAAVRAALLDVYAARETAAMLQRQERAQAEVVRLLEGQWRAGAIAAAELTPARIALDNTELALEQARGREGETRAALAAAIGLPADALRGVKLSFAGLDAAPAGLTTAEVQRAAIVDRADVRSALASYAASQAALQLEIAKQYPDIHLGPGYELDQTDNKWTLGLTLDLPIFNHNQGPIAEAKARRRLAAAQFLAVQSKALADTDAALAGYEAARRESATAASLQRGLRQRLDSARAMERAGEFDPLAVASAEVEYTTGELQRLDAVIRVQQALGALEAAVQTPALIPTATLRQALNPTLSSHEP